MTAKQVVFRKSLLAKIHTHSAYKHMISFEGWQDFLHSHFKVTSSAKLSINELISLIDLLDGNNPSKTPDFKGRKAVANIGKITIKQKRYIMKLLEGLRKDEKWFLILCFKTLKFGVFNIEHLSKNHASTMILALEKISKIR